MLRPFSNKDATAWVAMVTALALHVLDEATSGFLPFYNQLVLDIRDGLGFSPMPTFSYGAWLGGLIGAILIGYLVVLLILRNGRVIRIVTTVVGVIMVANALGHMLGSIYFGRLLPGFWSSPLLLLVAMWVVIRGATAMRKS